MDIQEQRKAIYELETAIEDALDNFRSATGLNVKRIEVQNLYNKESSGYPALKVNVAVSSLQG